MAVDLQNLISAGKLPKGTVLTHTPRRYAEREAKATVVDQGIRLGTRVYSTPSAAAKAITGKPVDGWLFWRLPDGRHLGDLRSTD